MELREKKFEIDFFHRYNIDCWGSEFSWILYFGSDVCFPLLSYILFDISNNSEIQRIQGLKFLQVQDSASIDFKFGPLLFIL